MEDHTKTGWPLACGSVLYLLGGLQYFVVQAAAIKKFPHYSLAHNTISDIGNTACAVFNGRYICSPYHAAMNVSFMILGFTMVLGSWLLFGGLATRNPKLRWGAALFAFGGLGAVLVGIYPENTVPLFHGLGAAAPFLVGNAGLVLLGSSWPVKRLLRAYTLVTGGLALAALVFYASGHDLWLGEGGIERVVAYPQTIWMAAIGLVGILAPALLARRSGRTVSL